MTVTATHRQRLDAIRERTGNARRRGPTPAKLLDAAREAGDQDAQAVAQIQLDDAATDLETSEALESSCSRRSVGSTVAPSLAGSSRTPRRSRRSTARQRVVPHRGRRPGASLVPSELIATINSGSWGHPRDGRGKNHLGAGLGPDELLRRLPAAAPSALDSRPDPGQPNDGQALRLLRRRAPSATPPRQPSWP